MLPTSLQSGPARRAGRLRDDPRAASYPLGLLIGGMVFVAAVGLLLAATHQDPAGREQAVGATQDADATTVLDLLVRRPGDWSGDSDAPAVVGFRNANGTGLDPVALERLHGAGTAAAANGLLDSDELLLALGLDPQKYGIHVRIQPKYAVAPLEVQHQHAALRTAYIGDWTSLRATSVQLDVDAAMVAEARLRLEVGSSAGAVHDRQILRQLDFDFNDRIHLGTQPVVTVRIPLLPDLPLHDVISDPTLRAGDVYPDQKQYLNAALPGRLHLYDVLVIGTGVDHNALTSNAVKAGIADWVRQGGMVVVLGSPDASSSWIQPLYHIATESETGTTTAPDADHGTLTHPYPLDWSAYTHTGTAWDLTGLPPADRDDVLQADGSSVLSYLTGAEVGSGTVVLTSLSLAGISQDHGEEEAQRLLTNMIARVRPVDLYPLATDYGEPVPTDLPVSAAKTSDIGWFPGYGFVPLDIEVLLWRTVL